MACLKVNLRVAICERFIKCTWYLKAFYKCRGLVFGRPFVKRFVLCYRTVVLSQLSVLSVMLVHCGETVGWIKMKLGIEVGLGPDHSVLGTQLPPKGTHTPIFGPCPLYPTAGRIKMPLGMEIGLGPGNFVLDGSGDPAPPKRRQSPKFQPMSIVAKRLNRSRCYLARR